jgi:hypothetical protein
MDESGAARWLEGVTEVFGVDFSGAREAGENMWVARVGVGAKRLQLLSLENMGEVAGTTHRPAVMGKLVEMILATRDALWGMDFPFALPVELFPTGTTFEEQLEFVAGFEGGAKELGLECVRRCQAATGRMHIRRQTDTESKTPFDCYHYRIVHQTFHGMRDVLGPLMQDNRTAIWPVRPVRSPDRVVVEACPSSTLKRLGMPHRNYKQVRAPLSGKTLGVRREMYSSLREIVTVPTEMQRTISRNPGGDALDAVVAAVGAWECAREVGEGRGERYDLEGRVYF